MRSEQEKIGFMDCHIFIIDWIKRNPTKTLKDLLLLLETALVTNKEFDRRVNNKQTYDHHEFEEDCLVTYDGDY